MTAETLVTLERRHDPVYGELWSLLYAGRAVVTRDTEFEVRQYARAMGWTVVGGLPTAGAVDEARARVWPELSEGEGYV